MKQKATLIGIVTLIAVISIFSFIWWESNSNSAQQADSNVKGVRENTFSSAIILEIFNGPVTVVENGKAINGENGMELKEGNIITTSGNGRAQIVFPNGTVTRLDKDSMVTLQKAQLSPQQVEIVVNEGQIWSRIAELLQNETYITLSEKVSAAVQGTSYGHSLVDGETDQIITSKGKVFGSCVNKKQELVVTKDQKVVFTCDDENPLVINLSNSDKNSEWYQFNNDQDESLNNRFGPFTYRDNENDVLGISDIFNRARELATNTVNTITGNNRNNADQQNTNNSTTTASNSTPTNNNSNNTTTSTLSPTNPANTPVPGTTNPTSIPNVPTNTPVPQKPIGTLVLQDGASATVYNPSTNTTQNAQNGTEIPANSTIKVSGGTASIDYYKDDYTMTRIDSGTTVTVKNNSETQFNTTVEVDGLGRIWNRIQKLGGQETFESDTGTMVATVRGTHYAHLKSVVDDKAVDQIFTIEGAVFGKCKNFPEKSGLVTENKKTSFNCIGDNLESFLSALNNLDTEDANWLIYNVQQDLPNLISGNKAPAVAITSPKEGEEFTFTSAQDAKIKVKADIDDDGKPFGEPGVAWVCVTMTKAGGIEMPCFLNAIFDDPFAAETNVRFSASGEYKFVVVVSDVQKTTATDVKFAINLAEENIAPIVSAGADQVVYLPNKAELAGTVRDDGLPLKRPLFNTWSLVKGPKQNMVVRIETPFPSAEPGTGLFKTKVDFLRSIPANVTGEYVFRLSSFDGSKFGTDDVVVQVNAPLPTNTPTPTPTRTPTPSNTPTPTPTPSPVAMLEISEDSKEAKLKIDNLFTYKSLSYIFTYESDQGQQGGKGGTDEIKENKYEEMIPLGTCSTNNVCTYHTNPRNLFFNIDLKNTSGEVVKVLEAIALTTPSPTPTVTPAPTDLPTPTQTPVPTPDLPAPKIDNVERVSAGCGLLSCSPIVLVNGKDFVQGAQVESIANTVVGSIKYKGIIQEFDDKQIKVKFNTVPKNTTFDVKVTNPNSKTATKNGAFNTK